MAHTPHTWTNGETITAVLLNLIETDLTSAGINSVVINTTPAGSTPTGSFAGNVITLNIPAAGTSGGSVSADSIVDGTTNKAYTATERTKLSGIAAGATVNRSDAATDTAISTAVANLVNGAPGALDQLNELAAALGNDANFAATIATALGRRVQTWTANTAYTAGQAVVNPSGQIVTANTGFTSSTTYSAANWTQVYNLTGTNTGDQTLSINGAVLTISGANGNSITIPTAGGGAVSDATPTAKGVVQLAGDLGGTAVAPTVPGLAGKKTAVVQQATQTASFTAVAGNFYPVNASAGNITVTLPTSTAGQELQIKKLDANAAIGATSGIVNVTGTINGTSGATIPLRKQGMGKQYLADGSGGWTIVLGDLDLTQLGATTTEAGTIVLAGDLGGTATAPTVPGKAAALTVAPVKTAAYTAALNEIVPADATSAAFTIALPTAPADKTRVTVKKIDSSTNAVTVATTGSDVLNKAGDATSMTLQLLNQASTFQYTAATGIWYLVGSDLPLTQLDGRYAQTASPTFTGTPTIAGNPLTVTSLVASRPSAASTSIPALLDTFTGTDATALTAHAADTAPGSSWVAQKGTFKLVGNKLAILSGADGDLSTIDSGLSAKFTVTADLTPTFESGSGAFGQAAIVFSFTDLNNFFYFTSFAGSPNSWTLYRVTAGTHTILLQVRALTVIGGTAYTGRIDRDGADITASVNGIELGSVYDTQGLASSLHGVRFGRSTTSLTISPTWDNFQVTPLRGARYNWPRFTRDAANPVIPLNTATRTDTVSYTSGSATITDSAILATDRGRPVKTASGIPSGSYVGTVTAGTSFLLSSSPTVQVNVNTTATVSGGSLILGQWNGTDLNDPCVAFDPVNNRWVMAGTGYFNDGTDPGIQTLGIYYAASLDGPWVAEAANPVLADSSSGKYNQNGGLVWYLDRWIYSSGAVSGAGNATTFWLYSSTDLKTWTKFATFPVGAAGSFDAAGCYDSFLRVRQDGLTLELWYAGVTAAGGNRKIGMASSVNGGVTWARSTTPVLAPPLFDAGGDGTTQNFFAEPSVLVPTGKEGREMLVLFDWSQPSTPLNRRIGAALTIDGGQTWHYRVVQGAGSGWESIQIFDSHPVLVDGRLHLFYGGANVAGSALNLNIQIGHASTRMDTSTLFAAAATG